MSNKEKLQKENSFLKGSSMIQKMYHFDVAGVNEIFSLIVSLSGNPLMVLLNNVSKKNFKSKDLKALHFLAERRLRLSTLFAADLDKISQFIARYCRKRPEFKFK